MSIPELNKVTKLQDEYPNSHSIKQEKPDIALDMDLVEKETVTPGPVTTTKSKDTVLIDIDIENSEDVPHDLAVWTQYGPTYHPLQTPEYPHPHGLEGFVHPQPKTVQGYPSAPRGGGYPRKQGHAYPGGGSPLINQPVKGGGQSKGGQRVQGQAPDQVEDGEDEDEEDEDEEWSYTPEKKNGWVFKVFAIVFIMNVVATVAIIVMEETLSDIFESVTGIYVGGACAVIMIICLALQLRKIGVDPPLAIVILVISVPCVACIGTAITVFGDTIIVILTLFALTVTVGFLMLLATTSFNFRTGWMYLLLPFLTLSLEGGLIALCMFVLQIEIEPIELIALLVLFIESIVFVFILHRVLGGTYKSYGDEIYAYTATLLFSTIVYVALVFVLLCGGKTKRRRRRRVF